MKINQLAAENKGLSRMDANNLGLSAMSADNLGSGMMGIENLEVDGFTATNLTGGRKNVAVVEPYTTTQGPTTTAEPTTTLVPTTTGEPQITTTSAPENLVTSWNDNSDPYDEFTSSGSEISNAQNTTNHYAQAVSNDISVTPGEKISINLSILVESGEPIKFFVSDQPFSFATEIGLSDAGGGVYYLDWHEFTVPEGSGSIIRFFVPCSLITKYSLTITAYRI